MARRLDSKWLWAAAFAALSVLDLYLTWLLIESFSGCVYESNPLAAWILERHGWIGLGSFKLACSALVVVLGVVVWHYRPRTGKRLLAACTLALVVVTGYSFSLWAAPALASDELGHIYELQNQNRLLEQERLELRAFAETSSRLSEALTQERVPLAEAAAELDRERAALEHYDPLQFLRQRYPDLNDEACLAASLVRGAAAMLPEQPGRPDPRIQRMADEFEAHYHTRLPGFAR